MSRQRMSVGEVREYIANQTVDVMSDWGKGYNKVLRFTFGGDLYQVIDHGDVVYSGADTAAAIEAYDSAGPR
jgi:hypothetical protein